MSNQIVELNGKKYNITIVPEQNERGIDVSEIFALLPTALTLVQGITAEVNAAKNGQLVAITVANCINKGLDFISKFLTYADLPTDAKKVTDKIITYAKYFAGGIIQIESKI